MADKKSRQRSGDSLPNQQLPQNIEAEKAVLAACMLNDEAVEEATAALKPENFFRTSHRIIFEAVLDFQRRQIPVDPISIADTLETLGQLEAAGGRSYLADLTDDTFALTHWRRHMDIVKRTGTLRDLVYAAAEINALAYDASDELNEVIGSAERALFNVTERQVASSFVKMDKLMEEAYNELVALSEQKGGVTGVPTGFEDVDRLFHGFHGGELIILAARAGVGKTAFVLNLAVNAARAGSTVALFNLEMSSSQLVQRMLSSEARVPLSKIRSGQMGTGDWEALVGASSMLSGLNLYIDDTTDLNILQARAKARRIFRHRDEGTPGLIIVDYLQLMSPAVARRDGNRAVEVGEISRGLKVLAKELNVPVIALSQLSRDIEKRDKKKRPMLSDLRESGNLEQDADIVMFVDRSMDEIEAEIEGRPELGTANLIVAKHRNGQLDTIKLAFSAEFTRFNSYADSSRIGDYV